MFEIRIDLQDYEELAAKLSPAVLVKASLTIVQRLGERAVSLLRGFAGARMKDSDFEITAGQVPGGAYSVVDTSDPLFIYEDRGTGIYGPKGQPIVITAKPGGVLRFFEADTKKPIFAHEVVIKGIKPRRYTEQAYEKVSEEVPDVVNKSLEEWWEQ